MRCWSQLLHRFYASSRSTAVSKGAKSELNFKEGNAIPNPYDIIDRNVPGIEKRLSLFEMRRLREQLEQDQADLSSVKLINYPLENGNGDNLKSEIDGGIELSYRILSYFPGLKSPSEASLNSSVNIRVSLEYLKLSEKETKSLFNFVKIDSNSKDLEFTVSDFPLVSQNKCRAIELCNALINFIRNQDAPIYDLDLNSDAKLGKMEKRKSDRCKVTPEFPAEWLLNLEKHQKIE